MADVMTSAGQPALADQAVLVTGAANGIGRATAPAFGDIEEARDSPPTGQRRP